MKALVLEAYNELVYRDVPEPTLAADEVLIEVKACGICGSDVHGMDGSTGRRIPPIIMGHEAAGVIVEVGPAVDAWQGGERVTFDSTIYCGECYYCRAGQVNLCENRRVLGVSPGTYRQHGAFADLVAVPARILYRLPDSVTFVQAAMLEPLSVAFHAASLPKIRLGDSAVVVGAGMIGLLVIRALRLAGCGLVVAVDLDPARLAAAKQFGADVGLVSGPDVPAQVQAMTEGRGADLAFEVVGVTAAVQTALAALRKGGSLTLVGNLSPMVELPLQSVVTRQITLYGSCASSGEYPACIDMLARGAVDVAPLISAVAPLSDAAAWFGRLYRREPGLMKVIVEPGA
ncbi:MAG: galactitol-1-phosphate 5-dehydrogenase [Anaerolineae bacterium]|jgi:L-iditol 2-dehydrogenase|nr:galactitol-1-phosphate 5-dehydrogenase [Anaerolineae bacterium]